MNEIKDESISCLFVITNFKETDFCLLCRIWHTSRNNLFRQVHLMLRKNLHSAVVTGLHLQHMSFLAGGCGLSRVLSLSLWGLAVTHRGFLELFYWKRSLLIVTEISVLTVNQNSKVRSCKSRKCLNALRTWRNTAAAHLAAFQIQVFDSIKMLI